MKKLVGLGISIIGHIVVDKIVDELKEKEFSKNREFIMSCYKQDKEIEEKIEGVWKMTPKELGQEKKRLMKEHTELLKKVKKEKKRQKRENA